MATKRQTPAAVISEIRCERCVGAEAADNIRAAILEALSSATPRIVVDLSASEAIDGSCLAVLLAGAALFPERSRLAVVASDRVRGMLDDWGIAESLCVYAAKEKAVGALEGVR